jgi:hypothetical protein
MCYRNEEKLKFTVLLRALQKTFSSWRINRGDPLIQDATRVFHFRHDYKHLYEDNTD